MVNRNVHLIIYLVLILILFSCSKKMKLNPNSSFGYEDLWNSYDSKTNIFTRKYNSDSIKVKIFLTNEEKSMILKSFSENDFQNLPREIDCSKWGVSPMHYDKIDLNNLSVQYIYNDEGEKGWFCPNGKKFNKTISIIKSILLNKPQVKKLEPSDIYYE